MARSLDVGLLAGAPTVGVANLQQDVVVTSHPCHAHELAHLLVNFWLEELPLFTLPLLQEGATTSLGGRWGRHPRVLDHVGRSMLTAGCMSLGDLLTRDGFKAHAADLTYASAGVFFSAVDVPVAERGSLYTCLVDVLQRIQTHPATKVVELTHRLWKEKLAENPLRSDLDHRSGK